MAMTIQTVIDTIFDEMQKPVRRRTVDTFKCGDPSRKVKGIVTTFMATRQVIGTAIDLGANLIITHEPTYYNHVDDTGWLQDDAVYKAKRQLLDRHHIAVWRFHDNWHRYRPDGITTGFVQWMGWEAYQHQQNGYVVTLPPAPLSALVATMKQRLNMPTVRVVGSLDMPCSKLALFLGAGPGNMQIDILRQPDIDTLLCGETTEWQTCEYVRDAVAGGQNKALIVLGHEKSEEAGMAYLAQWLQPKVPGITITHVPAGDPFGFI